MRNRYINITKDGEAYLTLQLILGYICYPVAFLLGVPRDDLLQVAQLIGIKVVANEFVAYNSLTSEPQYVNMSPRSRLIATYALCGMLLAPRSFVPIRARLFYNK
jgi:CNT family concentrative nucleoside transporter